MQLCTADVCYAAWPASEAASSNLACARLICDRWQACAVLLCIGSSSCLHCFQCPLALHKSLMIQHKTSAIKNDAVSHGVRQADHKQEVVEMAICSVKSKTLQYLTNPLPAILVSDTKSLLLFDCNCNSIWLTPSGCMTGGDSLPGPSSSSCELGLLPRLQNFHGGCQKSHHNQVRDR